MVHAMPSNGEANPAATASEAIPQEVPVDTNSVETPKQGQQQKDYNAAASSVSTPSAVSVEENMLGIKVGDIIPSPGADGVDDNSTVTSDGESSYFAKHLPTPKSGGILSFDAASIASNKDPMITSDASLSFSDDDEEQPKASKPQLSSPLLPPTIPAIKDLQYTGIARMHSISSLVADDEQSNKDEKEFDQSESELRNVAFHRPSPTTQRPTNPYSFVSSPQPQASPPTILQQFPAMALPHPQPLNAEQMQRLGHFGQSYGAMNATTSPQQQQAQRSVGSLDSRGSQGTLPLVYSDDENTLDDGPQKLMAAGTTGSGRGVFRGTGQNRKQQGGRLDSSIPAPPHQGGAAAVAAAHGGIAAGSGDEEKETQVSKPRRKGDFKVYWQRWVMLGYMSLLNLLSDWTCYSVAPIAKLTNDAFLGSIDPEQLVVIFLGANAVATACEPIILSRIGLRRTVVFGAFLLMIGSIIKSGGLPPLFESDLQKGQGEWRVYVGFFLVGLSQPLYQCTPALLSASWFPEQERTMATGVALNSNQLGIGFAFIFGTLLVGSSDDIVPYFGLLSFISTAAFLGSLLQFDDAPPTPPSDTARVIRGTLEWSLPEVGTIWQSVRNFGTPKVDKDSNRKRSEPAAEKSEAKSASAPALPRRRTTKRNNGSFEETPSKVAPSSASWRAPTDVAGKKRRSYSDELLLAPSPMMPGRVGPQGDAGDDGRQQQEAPFDDIEYPEGAMPPAGYPMFPQHPQYLHQYQQNMPPPQPFPMPPGQFNQNAMPPQQQFYQHASMQSMQSMQSYQQHGHPPPLGPLPPHGPQSPYGPQQHAPMYAYYQPNPYQYPPQHQQYPPQYQPQYPSFDQHHQNSVFPPPSFVEELAEPTLTVTDHHLDINIRDDQVLLSIRACFARPGFVHSLVAFTVSGIVINTLSTFMDYLVRLNGAGREYVGLVGGSFQFVIMLSSMIVGSQTDKTRAYYSVTIAMLVLGAFGLAECGVSLDADRGADLRWSLLIVAFLVGPLQPVSTELGVEVAYPLSENTVLVIQQLFSNLLSALFIPLFKSLNYVGTTRTDATELYERPQYTFSFYLLILLHAGVTVFFATFNGRYLRYEHELIKKEREKELDAKEEQEAYDAQVRQQWNRYDSGGGDKSQQYAHERQPLMS